MKKLISALAVLLISLSANAQIVSSTSKSIKKTTTAQTVYVGYENYSRFSASYASMKYSADGHDSDAMDGFDLGWDHGYSISNNMPLYLEGGIHGQFNTISFDNYNDDDTYYHVSVSVPLNLTYRLNVADSGLIVAPFAGINLKGNIVDDACDDDLNRIQCGYQVGLNLGFKALNVQVAYKADITEIAEKVKTNTFLVGLGINF